MGRVAILAAILAAACGSTQAEPSLGLPEAMQACMRLGADKDAIAAYATAHNLQPWSDADRQAFIDRAQEDARATVVDGVGFRLEINDVSGWSIGEGLSLYFLHATGVPEVTTPVTRSDGTTTTYSRSESIRCEVGGFGGVYKDRFYEAVAAVRRPSDLHIFGRSLGLRFEDDRGQAQYFLSVSGPNLERAIRSAFPDERPYPPIVRTTPAYGPQTPNVRGAQEVTIPKARLDTLLDQGSSFGFWVEGSADEPR